MNNVPNGKKLLVFWQTTFLLLSLCCIQFAFATPSTPTSDFIDNGDGTVTHKKTGLIWQRCALGQTWTGSGCSGSVATYTWEAAMALTSNFAGKSDWRLPNISELHTIIERENVYPAINNGIFPNTLNGEFWSSSPAANYSYLAWMVYFSNGSVSFGRKDDGYGVRLVRAGQWAFTSLPYTTPSSDFTDNGNGTVTHKRTGLIWQQCALGQTHSGSGCQGDAIMYSYDQAIQVTSNFADYNDWRLPTIDELLSIAEYGSYYPINQALFPNTPSIRFWSSSPFAGDGYNAWDVSFNGSGASGVLGGSGILNGKGNSYGIRLVRGTWSGANEDSLTVSARKDTSNPNAVLATCHITPPNGSTIVDYAWTGFDTATKYTKLSNRSITLTPGNYKPSCAVRFSNGGSPFTTKLIHQVVHKAIDINPKTVNLAVTEIKIPLDADGDALPDTWENYGVKRYHSSFGKLSYTQDDYYTTQAYLPLNKIGADALCKDIFVQIDHMGASTDGKHTHKLTKNAMEKARLAFFNAPVENLTECGHKGINLHVDYHPIGVMYFNSQTNKTKYWATYSKANEWEHSDYISPNMKDRTDIATLENDFNNYKNNYFPIERRGIFHYAVSGHYIFPSEIKDYPSGVSIGSAENSQSASDFMITFANGGNNDIERAGTFMHELGHDLGLHHGGFTGIAASGDDTEYKPNHFSIMNYRFQMKGITYFKTDNMPTNALLDYSRVNIRNNLLESNLNEPNGVQIKSTLGYAGYPSLFSQYGVPYTCIERGKVSQKGWPVDQAIDWNCDGDSIDTEMTANIDAYKGNSNVDTTKIFNAPLTEWDKLVYSGSDIKSRSIGGAFDNATIQLAQAKSAVAKKHVKIEEADIKALRSMPVADEVKVSGKVVANISAGGNYQLTYRIKNTGLRADIFNVETTSQNDWQIISPIQTQVSLQPKQWIDVHVNVYAPFGFPDEEAVKDVITLRAVSTSNENISDSVETQLRLE